MRRFPDATNIAIPDRIQSAADKKIMPTNYIIDAFFNVALLVDIG